MGKVTERTPGLDERGGAILQRLLGRRGRYLSYIRAITRDLDLAEDVFQEVCVAVLRRQGELRADVGLDLYFRKVARHAALAALKRAARRPVALSPELLESLDTAWSRTEEAPSARQAALRECVEKLAPKGREILKLRYRELLSGKGLAERIGTTVKGAYVALSRLHRALRDCVGRTARLEGRTP